MSGTMDCLRAALLTLGLVGTTAAGLAAVAFWAADAAQSEARVRIRNGETGCSYVPASEAVGALACPS